MASLSDRVYTRYKYITLPQAHFELETFRLVHYLHPSDYELRKLAGHPQPKPKSADSKGKNKKKKNKDKDDNNFTVPRNLDFQVKSFYINQQMISPI